MIARPVREVSGFIGFIGGPSELFRCEPPMDGHEYVIARRGPMNDEPYVAFYGATYHVSGAAVVASWNWLSASQSGTRDVDMALRAAGHTVERGAP